MKVEVVVSSEEFREKNDYRNTMSIVVDGKKEVSFTDGEPEDNNLNRNFNGVYKIDKLMKKAYEAGKNGESFELSTREIDDWE